MSNKNDDDSSSAHFHSKPGNPSDPGNFTARRRVLKGMAALPLAGTLVACGGNPSDASNGPSAPSPGVTDTPPPAPTPAAAPPAPTPSPSPAPTPTTAPPAAPTASPPPPPPAPAPSTLTHPGGLHTDADFARMRTKIAEGAAPWLSGWNALKNSGHSSLSNDMVPNAQAVVIRGGDGQNFGTMIKDMQRAYQLALRWKVSQDTAFADRAVVFLDAWSGKMTTLTGNADRFLAAGIYGYQWANVVELMRSYPGWSAEGIERFQRLLLDVFYPLSHSFLTDHNGADITNYWANWDLCNINAIMAIGICCDRRDLYNEAIHYYKNGRGNGAAAHNVYVVHPGHLGQWQESGRDQDHATLGMSLCGALCEMAWSQGDDLYGYWNNRLLSAAEYVAASNLTDASGVYPALPFSRYVNRQGTFTGVSPAGRPHLRQCWELLYNHYVNRKGLSAPYVTAMAAKLRPEQRGTGDDPGMGTLTFSREPIAAGAAPSGLTAYLIDGQVLLSWWGSAYATAYEVQRAPAASGPFTTLTSVGEERTHTDAPGPGTWHYRIVAVTPGGRLTGAEVRSIATTPQLRLHLPLNEGTGAAPTDHSGNGLHGSLVGGASWGAGRTTGTSAVALDGVSGHVALPTGVLQGLADFTIAVWVYRQSAGAGNARVFDFGSSDIAYLALLASASSLRCAATGTRWYGEENVASSVPLGHRPLGAPGRGPPRQHGDAACRRTGDGHGQRRAVRAPPAGRHHTELAGPRAVQRRSLLCRAAAGFPHLQRRAHRGADRRAGPIAAKPGPGLRPLQIPPCAVDSHISHDCAKFAPWTPRPKKQNSPAQRSWARRWTWPRPRAWSRSRCRPWPTAWGCPRAACSRGPARVRRCKKR